MDGQLLAPPSPLDDLPPPLAPLDVPEFLAPYGYHANSHLLWRGQRPPELTIRVHDHSLIGKHTYYHLDCTLAKSNESEDMYTWRVARRLAHLREGLHDPLRCSLGSSYQTYFCGVHFAHHLRPSGTTARLNAWCHRLADCLNSRLVPPEIAAAVLRVLGVPSLATEVDDGRSLSTPQHKPEAAVGPARVRESTGAGLDGIAGFLLAARSAEKPLEDDKVSEGASASTVDPSFGGLAVRVPSYTSPGGTSNCSEDWEVATDDSGEADDGEVMEADQGFDPFCGARRSVPLQ
mmetsp:Transcript_93102/g.216365  ORF Transcript_93102/g.216365 Transcript_93102/m.216365 type:complete len:291 (-) Transcript_93102:216-1088(-)|eukprot:CAMPEP_0171059942 /NCGR_PEP_ID=MMETSP0766_2-20121228/3514_1 /TAXON_ID=439317 /ORGANISM="Gambierdiscus australes, Strain CAWD 149" /LENGTH=290 /DNA_ID=CAMNT_0011515455 /DNA_START=35 /DNA_END=907 /DNA_ORIENTATION=+